MENSIFYFSIFKCFSNKNFRFSNIKMKLALRYIPTEVWVDVIIFPWITRKQLGKILHRFRNRKFMEILQYCLHNRGKRTLENVHLYEGETIPRTPLPDNIKFFKHITISDFDSLALDFLHRVSTLFLSNDVNLNFIGLSTEPVNVLANLRTVIDHLAPLLHGIHSMAFHHDTIPLVEQYFGPKLAQVKLLFFGFGEKNQAIVQTSITFCLNWLISGERDPAEPKLLKVYIFSQNFQQFAMAVQQQFISANSAYTFAIQLIDFVPVRVQIADFHLENNLGEQLHGEYKKPWMFQIFRHQPSGGAALQEWIDKTIEKRHAYASSVIEMAEELAIGPLDVNADAMRLMKLEQPSTSKKPN